MFSPFKIAVFIILIGQLFYFAFCTEAGRDVVRLQYDRIFNAGEYTTGACFEMVNKEPQRTCHEFKGLEEKFYLLNPCSKGANDSTRRYSWKKGEACPRKEAKGKCDNSSGFAPGSMLVFYYDYKDEFLYRGMKNCEVLKDRYKLPETTAAKTKNLNTPLSLKKNTARAIILYKRPPGKIPVKIFKVSRQEMKESTEDLSAILRSARMVPDFDQKTNSVRGFTFVSIEENSFFTKMGFKAGDKVVAVNEEVVNSPALAMEFYSRLKDDDTVSLIIESPNGLREHKYKIGQ